MDVPVFFQASLALSLSDHNPDLLTASSKHQILVYQADACYQACEYRKAEVSTAFISPVFKLVARGCIEYIVKLIFLIQN